MRAKAEFCLAALDAKVYLGCDTAQTPRSIARMLGNTIPEIEVHALLKSFRDARLIAEMDGRYLIWLCGARAAQEQVASAHVMRGLPESRLLLNEI